jgi:hypothetical protein
MKNTPRMLPLALLVVPILALSLPAIAQDCPQPGYYEPCDGCHVPGLNPDVELAYTSWLDSEHLNGVTFGPDFCKNCHQSFRGDPADCDLLAPDRANGIECATCHTERISEDCDRELRVWDRANCDYGPVIAHQNLDELCLTCHDRPDIIGHSAFDAPPQGWAQAMLVQRGVMCVDCHMAFVPFVDRFGIEAEGRTHNLKVADNLPYSCGTLEGGCHSQKTTEWALKQIEKNKIHGEVD